MPAHWSRAFCFGAACYRHLTGTDFILYFVRIMSNDPLIFICAATSDRTQLLLFKEQLAERNLFVRDGLEFTPGETDIPDFSDCILIVLLSIRLDT